MLDYPEQIKEYLQANFTPSDDDKANFKQTTIGLLNFLFRIFPKNCISDFDLNEILKELGYKRFIWAEDNIISLGEGKFEIRKELVTGWCLKTDISLRTEEIG